MLAQRKSVTEVAIAVGYDSVSAFIEMFRTMLGTTPQTYSEAGIRGQAVEPWAQRRATLDSVPGSGAKNSSRLQVSRKSKNPSQRSMAIVAYIIEELSGFPNRR